MIVTMDKRKIDIGPNPSSLAIKRWSGKLSPEPETVAWIKSLPAGKVFFDIGASVGTVSARAALAGLKVIAFEPDPQCFSHLLQLMWRNQNLDITPFDLAMSNVECRGHLGRGRSTTTFYADPSPEGVIPALSTTLDKFVERTGYVPDYIKLDVDGNEVDIIQGGRETFRKVQSALIEVDPQAPGDNRNIPHLMHDLGFCWDQHQVEECMIRGGKYDGTANYIFVRAK